MTEEERQEILSNMKDKSIGSEKKAKAGFFKKKIIMTISALALASTLLTACGYNSNKEATYSSSSVVTTNYQREDVYAMASENDLTMQQISNHQIARVLALLEEYGFTNYTSDGLKRHYNYTYSDYQRISEMDDSYLYGFYSIADRESFEEMLKGLGYTDLDDFLVQNGYIKQSGKPDATLWFQQSVIKSIREMTEGRQK